jgi:hypothetical protein
MRQIHPRFQLFENPVAVSADFPANTGVKYAE